MKPFRISWSYRVGRLFGIDVRVHLVFLLIIVWLCLYSVRKSGSLLVGAEVLLDWLLLFGFVLLHELGHSLAAKRHGIRVRDITLWPLGGLARLEGYTEDPRVEFRIALAGPAVNLAIALVLGPLYLILGGTAAALYPLRYEGIEAVLGFALLVNLMMGFVNLIPAFPLDGGRILRALIARRKSWYEATRTAVFIGRIVAWSVLLVCLYQGELWIALISLFILWAGSSELAMLRAREALRAAAGITGKGPDILDAEVVDAKGGGWKEAGSPGARGDSSLNEDRLKPYEREFIEQVRRLRKGRGDS